MAFNLLGALNDGYTKEEIAEFLAKKKNFNLSSALNDGYSLDEVLIHLTDEPFVPESPTTPTERSLLREAADVPLKVGSGVVTGIRFIADAFGADNPISKSLRGVEDYIGDLYSAQSKADSQEIARIFKEAEDKGVLDQVKAGLKALTIAPVDVVSNALGTAAPTILGGLAAGAARLGVMGVRGAQIGIGAGMGSGVVKSSIYDAVKDELKQNTQLTSDEIEQRAVLAQQYNGENLDMILAGSGLGALAGSTGIDKGLANKMAARILGREALETVAQSEARGLGQRVIQEGVREGVPEFLQGAQEQLAGNVALQREGFDVSTTRGVISAGTLEGLAGGILGGGFGALSPDATRPGVPVDTGALNQSTAERARQQRILEEAQMEQAEREAAIAAREAALRVPLTQQDVLPFETTIEDIAAGRAAATPQGDLFAAPNVTALPPSGLPDGVVVPVGPSPTEQADIPFNTTVEEIAARRAMMEGQGDLFAAPTPRPVSPQQRAPVQEQPTTTLTDTDIKQLGISPRSNVAKALKSVEGQDITNPNVSRFVRSVLSADNIGNLRVNEAAVDNLLGRLTLDTEPTTNVRAKAQQFLAESNQEFKNPSQIRKALEAAFPAAELNQLTSQNKNVYKELLDEIRQLKPQPKADRTSVSTLGKPGPVSTPPIAGSERAGLGDIGSTIDDDISPETGEPLALTQESVAPTQEPLGLTEEPVTTTSEPTPRVTPEQRAQRIAQQRAEEEAARRQEREAARAQALEENRGRTPTSTLTPGEIEGIEASRNEGVDDADYMIRDPNEVFRDYAKDAARTRQRINMAKGELTEANNENSVNPTPELSARINELNETIREGQNQLRELDQKLATQQDMQGALEAGDYSSAIDRLLQNPNTTEYQAELLRAIQNNDVSAALGAIQRNGATSETRLVARLLRMSNTIPSIQFNLLDKKFGLGAYFMSRNLVQIDPGSAIQRGLSDTNAQLLEQVIMHEVVHAATVRPLSGGFAAASIGAFTPRFMMDKDTRTQTKYAEAAQKIVRIFDYLHTLPQLKSMYGMTDPFEMLAESFTNSNFQAALKDIQLPTNLGVTNTKKSVWDAFINILKSFLGISQAPDSALAQILENGANLIDANNNGSSSPSPMQIRGRVLLNKRYGLDGNVSNPMTTSALEQTSDAILAASGYKPATQAEPSSPFSELMTDPKRVSTDFLSNVETRWFSSDAKLNRGIRNAMETAGRDWEAVRKALYEITTSQSSHADNVAHQVLELGNVKYDPETMKAVAEVDPEGSWKMAVDTVNEAADKYGIDRNKMILYAHQAFVANRLNALEARNQELEALAENADNQGKKLVAEQLRDRQVLIHLNADQRQNALKFLEMYPELNTAMAQWNKTRANIMKFAVDTGLYTQDTAETLLDNMDYVPFFRVKQLENSAGPREFSRGLLDASRDKKIKGSMDDVNNVFDNMARWINYTVSKGIKNQNAKNLADYAVQYMPDQVRPVEKTNRGMENNTIGVWVDGKRQMYEFDDPLFVDAFTGLEPVALPGLSVATKIANILRQNIVLNPLFSLGQLPQDAFGAMFSSGVRNPFAIPLEVAKEFVKTLSGTSQAHFELMRYGATGQRDYSAVMARLAAEEAEGLKPQSKTEAILSPLRKIATASDNAVRQAVYNQTLKETGDKALAVERAFEVINFRRSGSNPYINIGRQVVPFFGAYLQAMNVIQKTLLGKGIAPTERADAFRVWTNTIPKVVVLGLMYSMLIGDDEDYKKADAVTRARKLYIPGSGGLSIPLRPDLFTFLAKILPEQIYMNMTDEMTLDGTATRQALSDALIDAVSGPTAVPQFIKPVIEVSLNRNFFTGRPIVGQGIQYLDKPEQYTFNTSEISKLLGKTGLISPVVVDHIIRSYTGYTGGIFMLGIDAAIDQVSDTPRPALSDRDFIASIPGMSPFVSRENGAKLKNEFYELREKVNIAVNTYNRLAESRPEDAKAYREEVRDLLKVKTQVNRINQQLSDLRKRERIIREAPSSRMSAERKKEEIDKLRASENRMLANVARLRQQAGL